MLSRRGELLLWLTETGECVVQQTLAPSWQLLSWAVKVLDAQHRALFVGQSKAVFGSSFPIVAGAAPQPVLLSRTSVELESAVDVAVIAGTSNVIELRTQGAYCIAKVNVANAGSLVAAWSAPHLANVVYVTQPTPDSVSVWLQPTAVIAENAALAAAVAVHDANLRCLATVLKHAHAVLWAHWKSLVDACVACVAMLQRRLRDCGAEDTVEETLLDVLLCGPRIGGSLVWLEGDIGEKGAVKLSKVVHDDAAAIQTALQGPVLEAVERMGFIATELRHLVEFHGEGLRASGVLADDGPNPFAAFVAACDDMFERTQRLCDAVVERQKPFIAFCNWMCRTQKLFAYQEALSSQDEARRLEIEATLAAMRKTDAYDEMDVANFASLMRSDRVEELLRDDAWDAFLKQFEVVSDLRETCMNRMTIELPSSAVCLQTLPVRGLGTTDFVENQLMLLRADEDVVVLTIDFEARKVANIAMFDAPEGDVVDARLYKTPGSLVVLCCDVEGDGASWLSVLGGDEDKLRKLNHANALKLAVSRERGLAAVYHKQGALSLFDLEGQEDEQDEGEQEPMGEG